MASGDTNGCTRCGNTVNGICAKHKICLTCHDTKELSFHYTKNRKPFISYYEKKLQDLNQWDKNRII